MGQPNLGIWVKYQRTPTADRLKDSFDLFLLSRQNPDFDLCTVFMRVKLRPYEFAAGLLIRRSLVRAQVEEP